MLQILEAYEDHLVEVKHASENTVASYMRDLNQFGSYLQEQNIALHDVERQTIGDYMEYRYLEWNGGHVSSTSRAGSIGHMNWYIEDFDDYFIYNYCDVQPGMSGCAAVSETGNYIGMMIGGVDNESGALSAKVIEKIYLEME